MKSAGVTQITLNNQLLTVHASFEDRLVRLDAIWYGGVDLLALPANWLSVEFLAEVTAAVRDSVINNGVIQW